MNDLTIAGTGIRRDAEGRYSLNDLHRAAGGEGRHQPSNWLRLDTTAGLVEEISNSSDLRSSPVGSEAGRYGGTYVVRQLVVAYAAWISPKFHVEVIETFLESKTKQVDPMQVLADPAAMRGLLLTYTEKVIELEGRVAEQAPKVAFHDQVVVAPDAITMAEAAKILGTGRTRLMAELRRRHWLTRQNEPYQSAIEDGLLDLKLSKLWDHPEQGLKRSVTPLVTGKGLARLKQLGVGSASVDQAA